MLRRKMLRDVWKNKVPFLSIFLMMFAGNFIFSGITCEYHGMEESFHTYLEETKFADAWVMSTAFEETMISKLQEQTNLDEVERRTFLQVPLQGQEEKSVELYITYETKQPLGMRVVEGTAYAEDIQGIWLDERFAKANAYQLHDHISLQLENRRVDLEIVGFCESSEYIYSVKEGELLPDHTNHGFAFAPAEVLGFQGALPINQLAILGTGDVKKTMQDTIKDDQTIILLAQEHQSYQMMQGEIQQHKEIGLLFAAVFLLIALFMTMTCVHRLLHSQYLQIAILKALGFHKHRLYRHYLSHSVFVCLLGSVLGWLLGIYLLPRLLYPMMEELYALPQLQAAILPGSWFLPIICTLLCAGITLFVTRQYLQERVADMLYANEVLRPTITLPFSSILIHLSFSMRWNLRDMLQNKLRSLMSIFGVIGCVALLLASFGLMSSMQHLVTWTFDGMLTYEVKLSGDISKEQAQTLTQDIFGEGLMEGTVELAYENQTKNVAFTGMESQDYLRLFDESMEPVIIKDGVGLSRKVAEELHIDVGDHIQWRFIGETVWHHAIVRTLLYTPMRQGITMMSEDMASGKLNFQPTSLIGMEPKDASILSETTLTLTNKEDSQQALSTMLDSSSALSILFVMMAVLLGSVILYNLGTLSYMERYRDMATLKVLGFDEKTLQRIMIQQNIWLSVLGILLGLPVGYLVLWLMLQTIQSSIDIAAYLPAYGWLCTVLGTFLLSWLIAKLLSRKMKRIDMVAALKIKE